MWRNVSLHPLLRKYSPFLSLFSHHLSDPNDDEANEEEEEKHVAIMPWETTPSRFEYTDHGESWTGRCLTGRQQSPIDIVPAGAEPVKVARSSIVKFEYAKYEGALKMINTGKTVELSGELGHADVRNTKYVMREFAFHAPSEHTIEGEEFPLELQVYHQKEGASGNRDLLALSILFKEGPAENLFLRSLNVSAFPTESGAVSEVRSSIDLNDLHSSIDGDQMVYMGSRTEPGCEETVEWHVCSKVQPATASQIKAIRDLFGKSGNNRKMQLTGTRTVYLNALPDAEAVEDRSPKGQRQSNIKRNEELRRQIIEMYKHQQLVEGIKMANATLDDFVNELMGLKNGSSKEISVYEMERIEAEVKERKAKIEFAIASAKEKKAEAAVKKAKIDELAAATNEDRKQAEREAALEAAQKKAAEGNDITAMVKAMTAKMADEDKTKQETRMSNLKKEDKEKNQARILKKNREMRGKQLQKLIAESSGKAREEIEKKAENEKKAYALREKAEETEKAIEKLNADKDGEESNKNQKNRKAADNELEKQKEESRKRDLQTQAMTHKLKLVAEQKEKEAKIRQAEEAKEKDTKKKEQDAKAEQQKQRKLLAEKEAETKREEGKKAADKQKEEHAKEQEAKEKKKEEGVKVVEREQNQKKEEAQKLEEKIKAQKAAEELKKKQLKEAQAKQDAKVEEETEKFETQMEQHKKSKEKEATAKTVSQKALAARKVAASKEEESKAQARKEEEGKRDAYEKNLELLKKKIAEEQAAKEKAKAEALKEKAEEEARKAKIKAENEKLLAEKVAEEAKKAKDIAESKSKVLAEQSQKDATMKEQKVKKEAREKELAAKEAETKKQAKAEDEKKRVAAAAAKVVEEKDKQEQAEKKKIAAEKLAKAQAIAAAAAAAAKAKKAEQEAKSAAEAKTKYGKKISLQDEVEQYGNGYDIPIFSDVGKHLCALSGVLHLKGEIKTGRIIASLPKECRPEADMILDTHTHRVGAVPTLLKASTGVISVMEVNHDQNYGGTPHGNPADSFLSLDGLLFAKAGAEVMDVRGWNNWKRQGSMPDPVYFVQDGLCVFSGVLGHTSLPNPIAQLPYDCRVSAHLIFSVVRGSYSARINIHSNGYMYFDANIGQKEKWYSLSSIAYYPNGNQPLDQYGQGFSTYGYGHRAPAYKVKNDYCVVTGLARGNCGKFGCTVLSLPEDCRPYRKTMIHVNEHQYTKRLDIYPDGRIIYAGGVNHHTWISLDGIKFLSQKEGMKPHEYNEGAKSTGLYDQASSESLIKLNTEEWQPFGEEFRKPIVSRVGDFCVLSGLARSKNMRTTIATLHEDCAPESRLIFDRHTSETATVRYDINSKGEIVWAGGASAGGWIPLDGMIYPARGARMQGVHLRSPFVDFGKEYQGLKVTERDGFCVVTGLIRHVNHAVFSGGLVGVLPTKCMPDNRLIFHMNHHQYTLRMDVDRYGQITFQGGSRAHSWVSLSGMFFFKTSSSPIQFENGWRPHGGVYRIPSFRTVKKFCTVSGLIYGNGGNHMATLPVHCRPKERLIFNLNHYVRTARLDVLPDGRILYTDGGRQWGWVSLDGMAFMADGDSPKAAPDFPVKKAVTVNLASNKLLTSGVLDYGGEYEEASQNVIGNMCILQGLVKTDKPDGLYMVLDKTCRPDKELAFDIFVENYKPRRVDLKPNGELRFAGGDKQSVWMPLNQIQFPVAGTQITPFELYNQWVPFGKNFEAPGFIKTGSYCQLVGMIRTDNFNTNTFKSLLGRVPPECRPKDQIIMHTNNNELSSRIDCDKSGYLQIHYQHRTHWWVSLSGLGWFVDSEDKPLLMVNGWRPYNNNYRRPSIRKEGNLCVVSGLATGNGGTFVANLPKFCWPRKRLIFGVNHHNYHQRIDILPDGNIHWMGPRVHGWLSFDSIAFIVAEFEKPVVDHGVGYQSKEGKALKLINAFKPYRPENGAIWRNPMSTVIFDGKVCILGGVLAAADLRNKFAVLPSDCRPSKRLVFNVDTGDSPHPVRIDVWPSGKIGYAGGRAFQYISIEGIMFPVADKSEFTPLALTNNWHSYDDEGYAAPGYRVIEGICFFQGMVRYADWNRPGDSYLANVPTECLSGMGHMINHGNMGKQAQSIYIYNNRIRHINAPGAYLSWLSLQDLIWVPNAQRSGWLPQFQSGYRHYGYGYRNGRINKVKNLCILTGLARGSAASTVLSLPHTCRPAERLRFGTNNHNYENLMDVFPDGRVVPVSGVHHGWLSLDGIRFVVPDDAGQVPSPENADTAIKPHALKLLSGYVPYTRGYGEPTAYKFGSMCVLGGLARGDDGRNKYAQIPDECLPMGHLAFDRHFTNVRNALRVDITADGVVRYQTGHINGNYVNFDGMVYPAKGAKIAPLPLMEWYNYGNGMMPATYAKQGELCVLQGFLKNHVTNTNKAAGRWIAHMDPVCRPSGGRLIFTANHGQYHFRVDMLADGRMYLDTWNGYVTNWMSISGLSYIRGDGGNGVNFSSGWGNFNNGYRQVRYKTQGGICSVSGLANGNGAAELLQLPEECRPSKKLIFQLNHHYEVHLYYLTSDGRLTKVEGIRRWSWVSTSGIIFARNQ